MKNLISIAVVLALASGLILGSIGTLVPVVAQESNMTGGNMTGGNQTGGNQTGGNMTGGNMTGGNMTGGNQTEGGGGPLSNVPIIGDILGGK
jgi:uncharacterized membrane protein